MKKFLIIFFSLIFCQTTFAEEECGYNFECPQIQPKNTFFNSIFPQFNAIDYWQIKVTELAIEQYIKQKLKNDIKINIKASSAKALKNGEFEEIKILADKLQIQQYTISNVEAKTICPYNKISIYNSDYRFPYDIPAEFSANITNKDLTNFIASYITEINNKYDGLIQVKCFLQNSKLHILINSPFLKQSFLFSTGLAVYQGNLYFTDINNYNNSIYLKQITYFLNKINPLKYSFYIGKNAYCQIKIDQLMILDDKIYVNGIFIIPKNCDITE